MNEQLVEYAENFDSLYSKINDYLKLFEVNKPKEKDLKEINNTMQEMENILNNMEIENSMIDESENISNDISITKNCRNHYNDTLNKFRKIEEAFYSKKDEISKNGNNSFNNMNNIDLTSSNHSNNLEDLNSRYNSKDPFNGNGLFPSLNHIPQLRNVNNQRILLLISCLLSIYILYRVIF